ncbi:P-loop containing nucleoside triphosphate hydrolase protein [Fusarium sp. MPI-SDFR-AT-0072]|nr:P-loop containing nucleoside triphosphate hydrolase protein [Fusarium sp. MPI-SDFR-AT-0072]
MANSTAASKAKREMKVLALGLPRTGSASIAEALTILGYKGVHHGLKAIDSLDDWKVINRAADATFPVLPTYTGEPFTRDEWDELYGPCEAGTDMAALFATQLIKVYPNAKVILVVRDLDKWYASYETVFEQLWSFGADLAINYAEPLIGFETGVASRKAILGFFEARNVQEARNNAREVYERHYRQLREVVPPEKLLVYRMGEGWEPICGFLDKPVPDVEFPWINEAAALKAKISGKIKSHIVQAVIVVMPWVAGMLALAIGLWAMTIKENYGEKVL